MLVPLQGGEANHEAPPPYEFNVIAGNEPVVSSPP